MTDAMPERLWVIYEYDDDNEIVYTAFDEYGEGDEYIRADVAAAQLAELEARIAELSRGLHAALELIEDHQQTLEDNRVWGAHDVKLKQKAERALFRPVTADTP